MKLLREAGDHDHGDQLSGATLIVPGIGVGNVGQLTMDLLIETSRAPRVGRLSEPSLLPCVGVGAFTHISGTAYGLELFTLPGSNIYLVQQRAPAAPGRQREFAESLAAWAKSAGVAQVHSTGNHMPCPCALFTPTLEPPLINESFI